MVPGVRRGHNRENHIYIYVCLYWKKSSPEPAGQFQSNLVHIIYQPCVKGILSCSDEGSGPFQREGNLKNGVGSFENLLLKNHWARRAHIYLKSFWYNVDSSLYKSRSPGVGRGKNKENHIYTCLYWKKKSSPPEPASQFQSNFVQSILGWKELG
jgi:hypothetical protein